jgi:DNA-binding response OmpR family regulator
MQGDLRATSDNPGTTLAWPRFTHREMDDCILILIIDSDVCAANIFSLYLGLNGYSSKVANLGNTGLHLANSFKPEVIFCNLNLPDMKGHDLARLISTSISNYSPLIFSIGKKLKCARDNMDDLLFYEHFQKPLKLKNIVGFLKYIPLQRSTAVSESLKLKNSGRKRPGDQAH